MILADTPQECTPQPSFSLLSHSHRRSSVECRSDLPVFVRKEDLMRIRRFGFFFVAVLLQMCVTCWGEDSGYHPSLTELLTHRPAYRDICTPKGLIDIATAYLAESNNTDAQKMQLRQLRARACLRNKNFQAAFDDLRFVGRHTTVDESLVNDWLTARALAGLGRVDAAESLCASIIHRDPDFAPGLATAAVVKLAKGKLIDGMILLDRAIDADAQLQFAYRTRAEILVRQGKFQDALEDINRAITCTPDEFEIEYVDLVVVRGKINCFLDRPDAAVADLLLAMRLRPQDVQAIKGMCWIAVKSDRKVTALQLAHALLNAAPESPDALEAAQNTFRFAGQYREAILAGETWVRMDQDNPRAKAALARTRHQNGEDTAALDLLDLALKTSPNDQPTIALKAWILAVCRDDNLRNPAEAMQLITRLREHCGENFTVLNTTCAIQLEQGDFQSAERTLLQIEKSATTAEEKASINPLKKLVKSKQTVSSVLDDWRSAGLH